MPTKYSQSLWHRQVGKGYLKMKACMKIYNLEKEKIGYELCGLEHLAFPVKQIAMVCFIFLSLIIT